MYSFLKKHKILGFILDFIVILIIFIIIMYIFRNISKLAWFVPILFNVFVLLVAFYVNIIREPKKNWPPFPTFVEMVQYLNIGLLILHATIGFSAKNSHKFLYEPLWTQSKRTVILTSSIYITLIILSTLFLQINKYYKKRHKKK